MTLRTLAKEQLANLHKFRHLNAFVSRAPTSSVVARAEAAGHHEPAAGTVSGKLVAVKDNICTTDLPTTAASGILKNFTSPFDATVAKLLREAGGIVVGKTNMDEFGMGSHSTHSHFGRTAMVGHDGVERSAGGSSGGSAVAVATDQCWAALGTDTGGSVRLPAAYTHVVGFKPSYGMLSRWGVIPYANSLDTVGILAKDVKRVTSLFDTLNVYDPQDPTSLCSSTRSRLNAIEAPRSLRVGIPLEYNISSLAPAVRHTWVRTLSILQRMGCSLHTVRIPTTKHALSAYYILAPTEASSNLAKYDGVRYGSRAESPDGTPESVLFAKTRGQGFGSEVQRRILLGAFSLSAQAMDNYFIQAQKVRRLVQQDFDRVFAAPNLLVDDGKKPNRTEGSTNEGVDLLLCPTAPTLAPLLQDVERQDPVHAYMNDVFTVPASLAGLPAISVPMAVEDGKDDEAGKTAGMQLIGQFGQDNLVLRVADELLRAN